MRYLTLNEGEQNSFKAVTEALDKVPTEAMASMGLLLTEHPEAAIRSAVNDENRAFIISSLAAVGLVAVMAMRRQQSSSAVN